MERPFWQALEDISRQEGRTIDELCAEVAAGKNGSSLTSAIRVFVLDYLRRLSAIGKRAAVSH